MRTVEILSVEPQVVFARQLERQRFVLKVILTEI